MEMEFRMFFRFNQCIGNLDKKRFQITVSARNTSGFYLAVALVIARVVADSGDKALR